MTTAPREYRPVLVRSDRLLWVFLCGFGVILGRLIWIQVVKHNYYMEEIRPLIDRGNTTSLPYPGTIFSHDRQALAESSLCYNVIADPARMLENHETFEGAAGQLSKLLGRSEEEIAADLQRREKKHYCELARFLTAEKADEIKTLGIKGISLVPQWKREYASHLLACHVLGGRDRFHQPLSGLELQYRLLLDGKPGATLGGSDPLGLASESDAASVSPSPGKDLYLTIDSDIQKHVETALQAMWERERPIWGSAVVLDPRTGAILATAARPGYDPSAYVSGKPAPGHRFAPVPQEVTRNIPVTEATEPGSTFKVLLAAAALDRGVVVPGSTFQCPGHINVGGRPISCWGKYAAQGHGTLDVQGMLAQSCNVAAAQIAMRLGARDYYAFLRKCGIGLDPEAGFPAEAFGLLRKPERTRVRDLATMGFGQNVSCSSLQLTSIIGGIVNGGVMKHPHIVDRVENKDGTLFRRPPVAEHRLCSEQTSALIRQMMEYTVQHGTGRTALMPGYRIGAKTGTAQQWDKATGRHKSDAYMVSFVEIVPADAPRYVIYVACNEPKVGQHGSDVCGPVCKQVADYLLRHYENMPGNTPATQALVNQQ